MEEAGPLRSTYEWYFRMYQRTTIIVAKFLQNSYKFNTHCRKMSMATNTSPAYGLNEQLSIHTPEPPVPMAKAWAANYPSPSSPFYLKGTSQPLQPLLNLAQGVPGHPPQKRLLECMDEERDAKPMETHGYGGVFGDEQLRTALAADIVKRYGGHVSSNEVAITAGANLAAAVTFHSLASPGEAIVLVTPWYFNHQMTLASLGINVIPLSTKAPSFRPEPEALKELLEKHNGTPESKSRIKAVVLVTPNNPTGSIYPASLLRSFADICRTNKIALILDETYRDFLLEGDGDAESIASDSSKRRPLARAHDLFESNGKEDWRDCVISIHSFSKSYAIPGHRLGAIIAHPSLLISEENDKDGVKRTRFGSFAKSLDNMQICPARTDTQRAVARCIQDEEHQAWRLDIANDLAQRRKKFFSSLETAISFEDVKRQLKIDGQAELVASLASLKDISSNKSVSPKDLGWEGLSAGAYYAYVRHPFESTSSELVAQSLAALVGVVVLPGSFFRPQEEGQNDRDLRFSIANVESAKLETLAARLILFTYLCKIHGPGWGL